MKDKQVVHNDIDMLLSCNKEVEKC